MMPASTTLEKPCIIMVDPTQDGNIGSAARAMANFGLTDLRLVRPKKNWKTYFCCQMASGANHVLENVKIFDCTKEAVQDLQRVYATSARKRKMIKPVLSARQAGKEIASFSKEKVKSGFLFGTEKSGLQNEDITLTDAIVYIPLSPDHASLNLSQAVLLLAYEWYQFILDFPQKDRMLSKGKTSFACKENFEGYLSQLEKELDFSNFWRVSEKKPEMLSSLRNIFQRCDLTEQEVRTLRGVVSALVYHRWQDVIDPGTRKPRKREEK